MVHLAAGAPVRRVATRLAAVAILISGCGADGVGPDDRFSDNARAHGGALAGASRALHSPRVIGGTSIAATRSATRRFDEVGTATVQSTSARMIAPLHTGPELPARGPASATAAANVGVATLPPLPIPSPSPSASFLASLDAGLPPDTQGAAGPNHLVVALNGRVRVQSKTGQVLSTVGLSEFFAPVAPTFDVFDPMIKYDPLANRFVLMAASTRTSPDSSWVVAVSQSSDPTGNWHLYSFDADAAGVLWIDFPKLGMNKNWIIVQGTMYGGVGLSSTVLACNKAALMSGTGTCTRFTGAPWRTAPAVTFDPTMETEYLARNAPPLENGTFNQVIIDTITGPIGAEVLTLDVVTMTMPEFWRTSFLNGPNMLNQLGSTNKLPNEAESIASFVVRDGSFWGGHNACLPAETPTRSATQWWQASLTGTVQQFGRVDDPTGLVSYNHGSMAVNKNGDVLVGFSRFTAEQYVAVGYAFRAGTDPAGAMRIDAVLKPGETPYELTRWGDYSATAVDPANDTDLWTIQEYAASPTNSYGTWWGRITPPGPTSVVTVGPAADAYVQDGASATTNFGGATSLQVKSTASTGTNRWTYLRFPITAVSGTVSTARLRLHGSRPTTANGIPDSAFAVTSNSWTEGGINWNNKPAPGAAQGFGVAIHTNAHYYEWDVTPFVKAQKAAGATAVSLAVRMDANVTIGPDTFSSKEAASNRPQLTVVFSSSADAPPTVAVPAAASPSTVTGTTTALSVLGADDGGESALTYTWSASGPAAVSFSVNGSNGAKNSTATFTQAGSYTLTATIRDGSNQTATSGVAVTVSQTLTSISVTPASASVPTAGTQQFSASARDQFGAALASQPSFVWMVSGGGSISATGLFTAGTVAGGPFVVTAASGGKSGTAQVTVTSGGSTVTLTPVADAHVRDGTSAGTNFGGATALENKNSTVAGNHRRTFFRFAIDSVGSTVTAATLRLHGASVTSAKLVGVFAVSNVTWGENTITFSNAPAIGAKQGGSQSVGLSATYVEWDLTSYVQAQKTAGATAISVEMKQDVANNEGATTFSSKEAATNRPQLVVTSGAGGGEPPVVVTPPVASPNPAPGTTTALSVLGGDDQGEAALTYTWSATGPAAVSFSANGTNAAKNTTATFVQAGSYQLLATIRDASNQTVTSAVTVTVSQTLTTIVVAPSPASVPTGGTQQFTATGRDQFGVGLIAQPTFAWSVSGGGSISASGLYTAGPNAGGPFTVTASSGGRSGTAQVTVVAGGQTVTLTPVADAYVRDGTSAGSNFGTATVLEQKNSTVAGNHRRTFVRFAIDGVSGINAATLRVHGSSVTSAKLVGVFAVSNVTWGETTITFNNAPAIGVKQGSSKSVGTSAAYVEWDVTSYLQAQKAAGATAVSFELKQDTANNEGPTTFSSKEAAANRPQLVVVTP